MNFAAIKTTLLCMCLVALGACAGAPPETPSDYASVVDGDITLPEVPAQFLETPNRRETVDYTGTEDPGTIVVDPYAKFLYYVEEDGRATRYPVAVGREGRGFKGNATIRRVEEWPGWTPTANMLRTEPEVYGPFARGIPGGVASPLGARALYLYRGSRDTRYRIHGTNDMESIGNASSAGCIRMFNQDVIHLAERAELGTDVVVRTYDESVEIEGMEMANRGFDIPPKIVDPEVIYAAVEAEEARRAAAEE